MRIISGLYKSRILKTPNKTSKVRPSTDRVRETIFNILNNILDLQDSCCLDLFSGTGSFGLECISRGAKLCYFVDKDTKLILENIKLLNAFNNCKVIKEDVLKFLEKNLNLNFDLIFADPYYNYRDYNLLIDKVAKYKSIFVLEYSEEFEIDEVFETRIILKRKIGNTQLVFFNFN